MKKNTKQQTEQNNNKRPLTTIKTAKNKTRKRDNKKKKERGKKSNSTELSTSTWNSTGYPTKVARIKGHLLLTILSHRGMIF